VKVVRTEYSHDNLVQLWRGFDAVVSATGVQTFDQQAEWIKAAHEAGVKRFILNDYANSIENQRGVPELEQFRDAKRDCLALAKQLAAEDDNFSWSALATGNFIDLSLKKYPIFGFEIPLRKARLVDDGTERLSAVTVADIGKAVRGILRQPEETKNRYLHIRSVETCQKEILAALQDQTGAEWEVRYEKSSEMYERGKAAFKAGERSGMLDLLVTQLFQKGSNRSIVVSREKSDNELLGVEEKSISVIVRDVLATLNTV